MAGSCQHGNETSDTIKGEELSDLPILLRVSQVGLCSMELITEAFL